MGEPLPRTYNPEHFARLFEVEDRHFWFRARNDLIASLLCSRVLFPFRPPKVLEVGCGTGNTLRVLEQVFGAEAVTGMDLFEEGLQYARQRTTCPLVCADVHQHSFSTPFDLVCLFDVLEHLPDDLAILRSINRLLVMNGTLFLTVPARQSLWSYFDEDADHVRRYGFSELEMKLKAAGFAVKFQSEFMMSLYPILWLGRRLNRWMGRSGRGRSDREDLLRRELQINPVLNRVLYGMLSAENQLVKRGWRMPVGSSLLAIAKKVRATEAPA